jgi:hypothetical protein
VERHLVSQRTLRVSASRIVIDGEENSVGLCVNRPRCTRGFSWIGDNRSDYSGVRFAVVKLMLVL